MRRILLAALLAMPALVSFDSASLAQGINSSPRTIDVTGHGDSSAKPDMMTSSFMVTARADTADECTRKESEKSRQVIDALKAKLGDSTKITTSDFSFSPSIEYGNGMPTPVAIGGTPEPPPTPTWRFTGEVDVFTDSIDPIADLLDTGIAAGASTISESGVSETAEDWDPTAPPVSSGMSTATGTGAYRRFRRMYRMGLSIETTGVSASDAMRKGTALMKRVQSALRDKMSAGQGRVETGNFAVNQMNPQQEAERERYQPPPPPQPQHKVYDAQVTITVETPKLELLGPSVAAAMKSEDVRLNQVSFSLKDDSAARKEAIEKASADAKSKADTLASSMGVKLKGILRISTNAQFRPYVVYGNQYMGAAAMSLGSVAAPAAVQAPMPVTPRDVGFGADVNVTYQIE
jgi:uncharacterized protein YggE